ncbi:MAG: phosphatidylglycerol lysyltransferase domain-containing protein [Desulfuromonadaceae bacterium]|nr:phosphatidylglycerol lysyltransferase domain-containing protein [Desulfuromonadaceae bacterium]MDD2850039.1 phosphatidylglycerol lysyltransferase domain-containing protein [Desulfuromonadaceae bacterium]MDD4129443.1 phosphatidylglycerol lysyltransferase domain-containing protein [Desulfuromonadaceae bacterium]
MEIPHYPKSRALTMADKPLLDLLCSDVQPRISELTFAGLYLFRNAHDYRLSTLENALVVHGKGYTGTRYFLPPLGGDIPKALKIMLADGQSLYGADDLFVQKHLGVKEIQCTELRDSHDYLYLREELAMLPGSRFHKKKNRVSYFTNRHEYTVSRFSREHIDGCLNVLNKWLDSSMDGAGSSLSMEMEAASEALKSSEALGLEGVVVIVNSSVAAFALGERLNRDTAVCHFEKADPFMEGLNQMVNREFARMLFQECTYVNREQDLGDMGLRSAKLSYHPVELIKKYLCHKA